MFRFLTSVLGALMCALLTGSAEAGLAYVSQERRVEASLPYLDLLESKGADGFGPFDESVEIEAFNEFGDRYFSRSTQSSVLGDRSVQASGEFGAASGGGFVGYHSQLAVTFDVATETPYAIGAAVELDWALQGGHPDGDLLTVLLRRVTPGADEFLVERRIREFDIVNGNLPPDFAESGMMAPGRYELTLEIQAAGIVGGREDGTYQFDFRTGSNPAVPLPPAAWMGLLTLGGIVGSRVWAARRARTAVAAT
jgi:hypothetical protein